MTASGQGSVAVSVGAVTVWLNGNPASADSKSFAVNQPGTEDVLELAFHLFAADLESPPRTTGHAPPWLPRLLLTPNPTVKSTAAEIARLKKKEAVVFTWCVDLHFVLIGMVRTHLSYQLWWGDPLAGKRRSRPTLAAQSALLVAKKLGQRLGWGVNGSLKTWGRPGEHKKFLFEEWQHTTALEDTNTCFIHVASAAAYFLSKKPQDWEGAAVPAYHTDVRSKLRALVEMSVTLEEAKRDLRLWRHGPWKGQ